MQFTDEQIVIEPGHCMRTWQSCDYKVNGIELFHERTRFPHSPFKKITTEQWTNVVGTKAEVTRIARKHGGIALEQFYAPEGADAYFLAFSDTEKALAFCRTEDFDLLCVNVSMDKIEEQGGA